MALLNWRNTPTVGMKSSPAQRLLGRRTKTTLPIRTKLLQEQYDFSQDYKDIQRNKVNSKKYYDQHTKVLPGLKVGNYVRIQPVKIGDKKWSRGKITRILENKKYEV